MSSLPLFVVIGATGIQGGSVVYHFLSLSPPPYRLRGLTRNPSSDASKALAAKGVEVVAADLDDVTSLNRAFEGATAVFAVTDFWGPYHDPKNKDKGKEKGMLRNEWAYEYELHQGLNIFQAASETPTLQRLIYSGLADTSALSSNKYKHAYHFASKGRAVNLAREKYPDLMAKTSVILVGGYLSNWISQPQVRPQKDQETGKYIFGDFAPGGYKFPLVAAEEDTGPLTEALLKVAPGKNLLAYREKMPLAEFVALWADALGKDAETQDMTFFSPPPGLDEEAIAMMQEFGDTVQFALEFGYAGENVDKTVIGPEDLEVEVKLPTIREWVKKQDWSSVL